MISVEEQIRRYAIDTSGPALGDPPVLDHDAPRRRTTRAILVAAMILFVAGIGYLAVRAGSPTPAGPPATTPPLPASTSFAAPSASCAEGLSGTPLAGPDGAGICIAFSGPSDALSAILTINGVQKGSMTITDCEVATADNAIDSFSGPDGTRSASLWLLSSNVQTIVTHPPDASQVVAQTFEIPGFPELRLAAFWIPNPDSNAGPFELYTASDELFVPPSSPPVIPSHCPEHQ